jgi:hypothetical protein
MNTRPGFCALMLIVSSLEISAFKVAVAAPPPEKTPPPLSEVCKPDSKVGGLRICSVMWLFKMELPHASTLIDQAIDTASEIGTVVGTSVASLPGLALEQPKPGVLTWTRPTFGDWGDYVFCNYGQWEVLKIPQKGNRVRYGWRYQKSGSFEFDVWLTKGGLFQGRTVLHERLYYKMVHKDDRQKAIEQKLCVGKAPNDP